MITVYTVRWTECEYCVLGLHCVANEWMDGSILFGYFVCVSFRFNWTFVLRISKKIFSVTSANRRWLLDKVGRQRRKWFRFFLLHLFGFFLFFNENSSVLAFNNCYTQPSTDKLIDFGHSIHNKLPLYKTPSMNPLHPKFMNWPVMFNGFFFAIDVPTQYWHLLHINNVVCILYWLRFGKWKKGNRRTHNITYNDFKAAHNCLACTQARTNENQSPFNSKQCDAFQRPSDRPMRKQH